MEVLTDRLAGVSLLDGGGVLLAALDTADTELDLFRGNHHSDWVRQLMVTDIHLTCLPPFFSLFFSQAQQDTVHTN